MIGLWKSGNGSFFPYKQPVGGSNPSTPTRNLEEIRGFFYAQNFENSESKSTKNLFRIKIKMFLDFFNSKISGYWGVFFRVKPPTNSSNFKTCFRTSNPLAKNLQKNLEKKRRDLQKGEGFWNLFDSNLREWIHTWSNRFLGVLIESNSIDFSIWKNDSMIPNSWFIINTLILGRS